jgi:hypothetical protein
MMMMMMMMMMRMRMRMRMMMMNVDVDVVQMVGIYVLRGQTMAETCPASSPLPCSPTNIALPVPLYQTSLIAPQKQLTALAPASICWRISSIASRHWMQR